MRFGVKFGVADKFFSPKGISPLFIILESLSRLYFEGLWIFFCVCVYSSDIFLGKLYV